MEKDVTEKERRGKAISIIDDLYPSDIHLTTGRLLLIEAIAASWRELPLSVLERLAMLNEEEDRRPLRR